jgi:ATP-dependent DNA helicase RecQ
MWEYVERSQCRRAALLRHFGDDSPMEPSVDCCDSCAPDIAPPPPAVPARSSGPAVGLDEAILELVHSARPAVGRTRAVEILRGGRSKLIGEHAYDQLALYGMFAHLRSAEVLGHVDQLLQAGALRSTGGRFPKLRVAALPPGARAA